MFQHKRIVGLCGTLWLIAAGVVIGTLFPLPFTESSTQARVVEQKATHAGDWGMITEADVASGATIPSGRHVFFRIPLNIDTIDREALLGQRGKDVRYWGYCLPSDNDPENPKQTVGFPGKLFLSEAERRWRKAQEDRQRARSPFQAPSFAPQTNAAANPIRHQIDTMRGGMTCYIMTSRELPIGTDVDGDGLNSKLESQYGTDPTKADTDGDGLNDGIEVWFGTDPLRRDTDGDGLIDGIEDKNDRKSTRLNSSHLKLSRMPSSA